MREAEMKRIIIKGFIRATMRAWPRQKRKKKRDIIKSKNKRGRESETRAKNDRG